MTLTLKISAGTITIILLKIIFSLLIANLLSIYLKYILGYESAMGLINLFDFDQEFNIPALYSAMAILFAAGILWFIAKQQRRKAGKEQAIYWKILCFIFVFLSLDELIGIHEHFTRVTALFGDDLNGVLQATSNKIWFIPYGICFIAIGAFFMRFFLKLPFSIKRDMLIAGIVFVAGAVGMELLSGITVNLSGEANIFYALIYTAEELFEMLGIVLFIRTLIQYVANYLSQDSFHIHTQIVSSEIKTSQPTCLPSTQTISVLSTLPGSNKGD